MDTSSTFTVRGGHVLAGLILFFAAIIAINVAFAVAAVRTFPGEDERRSYTQGLHYNATLAERRHEAAIGWQARTELTPTQSGARLIVRLADRAGAPVEGASLEGVLRWPPNESGDRQLVFVSQGGGVYAADIAALSPGRWDLRARAHDPGNRSLTFESELTWPSTR